MVIKLRVGLRTRTMQKRWMTLTKRVQYVQLKINHKHNILHVIKILWTVVRKVWVCVLNAVQQLVFITNYLYAIEINTSEPNGITTGPFCNWNWLYWGPIQPLYENNISNKPYHHCPSLTIVLFFILSWCYFVLPHSDFNTKHEKRDSSQMLYMLLAEITS